MTLEEAYRQAVQERQERAGQNNLNGLQGIPNDIDVNRMPGPPAIQPSDRIPADQGYQMQPDPNNMTNPPARQMADQAIPMNEARLGQLAGWADAPEQGGLGLAGPGPLPDRQETLDEHFARQLFPGFKGELGFWDKARLRTGMMEAIPSMAAQRQTMALKVAELEEQKRQHNWGVAEKLISTGNIEALDKFGDEFPPAKMIAQAVSKQDLAELPTFIERGYLDPQFVQRFVQPKPGEKAPSVGEIRSHVDMAKSMYKEDVKVEAKNRQLELAMNTPKEQRRPSQQQLVDEHQSALDLKAADTDFKKAQAEKARMEAQRGPLDNSNLEKIHEMVSGGQSWRQGTPQTQQKALDAYARLMPEGRTAVMMGTPIPAEKRSNLVDRDEFLKHDKIVNPQPGATEGATRSGAYVEMTDRQREDWGNLVNSGATLQTLFDEVEPLIVADTSMKAAKQFARLHLEAVTKKNPAAATYLADSEAFSSRMARVFGSEVGVLTNPDVTRWQRALPTFGDTKQVVAEKKRIFTGIYKQTKEMYKKKIAGEDISEDLVGMRRGLLKEADKLGIASMPTDDQFNLLMGK